MDQFGRNQKLERVLLDTTYFVNLVKKLVEKMKNDGACGQEIHDELIWASDTCLAEIRDVLGIESKS
jgi:hypothetical protein